MKTAAEQNADLVDELVNFLATVEDEDRRAVINLILRAALRKAKES